MKIQRLSTLLPCVAGLLLLNPYRCQGKALLRGDPQSTDESLLETVNLLLEQVSSLQQEHSELVKRISSLEQERSQLEDQVQALEDVQEEETKQKERRLQQSCIAHDSKEAGVFVIDGCNVHIQNGGGMTSAINGLGNLIVGYNELDNSKTERTGSHNVVVGVGHQYKGHSGFVAGRSNSLNSDYASIAGGHHNVVDAFTATIGGGQSNVVKGDASHVSGGSFNMAVGMDSMILGGSGNTASGLGSAVVGGRNHNTVKNYGVVLGGDF